MVSFESDEAAQDADIERTGKAITSSFRKVIAQKRKRVLKFMPYVRFLRNYLKTLVPRSDSMGCAAHVFFFLLSFIFSLLFMAAPNAFLRPSRRSRRFRRTPLVQAASLSPKPSCGGTWCELWRVACRTSQWPFAARRKTSWPGGPTKRCHWQARMLIQDCMMFIQKKKQARTPSLLSFVLSFKFFSYLSLSMVCICAASLMFILRS